MTQVGLHSLGLNGRAQLAEAIQGLTPEGIESLQSPPAAELGRVLREIAIFRNRASRMNL